MARYFNGSSYARMGNSEAINPHNMTLLYYLKVRSGDSLAEGDRFLEIGGKGFGGGGLGLYYEGGLLNAVGWSGSVTHFDIGPGFDLTGHKDVWLPCIIRSDADFYHEFWVGQTLVGTYSPGINRNTNNTYIALGTWAKTPGTLNGKHEGAECVIWDALLSNGDIEFLKGGEDPAIVAPGDIIRHWKIEGDSDPEPEEGGATGLTITGTAVKTTHPVFGFEPGPGYGDPPDFYVGSIDEDSATLSVDPLSEYLEVRFQNYYAGAVPIQTAPVLLEDVTQTGSTRFYRFLTGLNTLSFYQSRAKVLRAGGWSPWSDTTLWNTREPGWNPGNRLTCPPGPPGVFINPDANPPTNREGSGWFTPHPGQPLRGTANLVFRWIHTGPIWDIYISDDLGATWAKIKSNLGAGPEDGDGLFRYTMELDTTAYTDGMDYRLKAVSVNTSDDDVISLSFPIDNAEAVYWWKQTYDDPGERFGKAWAQEGRQINGTPTGDPIWYKGRDGCLAALRGHDHAALVDLDIPPSLGGDVTIRFYIWSGEGGFLTLQGRDDVENFVAGIAFFAKGETYEEAVGLWVGANSLSADLPFCCDGTLIATGGAVAHGVAETPGFFYPTNLGGNLASPIEKFWFKCMNLPRWHRLTPEQMDTWPEMRYRNGPEPGVDLHAPRFTCARRWEQYALRVRAELDPGDSKRVRIRTRIDGMGVTEPASGYWHSDDWHEASVDFEVGHLGFMSFQLAQQTYGAPNGGRIFLSWSALPLNPADIPPIIPPYEPPPWNPPQEGQPCTLVLQVFDDDRKRVKWEVGTDRYHGQPYLVDPENYGEQEVDMVKGAATIGQVEVIVIDKNTIPGDQDAGWLTARLSIESVGGLHGRRCRLIRYVDPTRGWVVIADGPASTPEMDESYSAFRWIIRDTRETERKVRAFIKADTSWVLPMGVPAGFGAYVDENGADQWLVPPQDPLIGDYQYDTGDAFPIGSVTFYDYWSGPFGPGGQPVGAQTVESDVVIIPAVEDETIADSEILGDPTPVLWTWPRFEILWRLEGSGDPWTVVDPMDTLVAGRSVVAPPGTSAYWRKLVTVWAAELADGSAVRAVSAMTLRGYQATGTFPTDGDSIEIAVRWKGEPTDFAPLHIEGMTSGAFLKQLYDGEYSPPDPVTGEVVPTGIRYHEADLLEVGQEAPDTILLRITEPVEDLRAWAEERIYSPTGWCPALNNDGEISPRSQIPPATFEGLQEISNAITEPSPTWDAGERIVNVIRYNYPRHYRVDLDEAEAVDLLEVRDVVQEYRDEASITRHGLQVVEFDGQAFSAMGGNDTKPIVEKTLEQGYRLAVLRRLYVFDRYRNGAPTLEVPVRRDYTWHLRAGDWVTVDLSWFPDYVTDRRGLITGGQILAINDVDCEWRVLLIEEALPVIPES